MAKQLRGFNVAMRALDKAADELRMESTDTAQYPPQSQIILEHAGRLVRRIKTLLECGPAYNIGPAAAELDRLMADQGLVRIDRDETPKAKK